jgi:hypothetical protein
MHRVFTAGIRENAQFYAQNTLYASILAYKFAQSAGSDQGLKSALTLLVAWILANNADNTITADDLAVTAQFFYRSTYFHAYFSKSK